MQKTKVSDEDVGIIIKQHFVDIGVPIDSVEFSGEVYIIKDDEVVEKPPYKRTHKKYGDYLIDDIDKGFCTVTFKNTSYSYRVSKYDALRGKVLDRFHKTVYGLGFLGGTKYSPTKHKQAYDCWYSMMTRCYYEKGNQYNIYGGRGVTVSEEWHNFQTFAEWYMMHYQSGFELDKDLLGGGADVPIYSAETCVMLPKRLNLLVRDSSGVSEGIFWDDVNGKYTVCCSNPEGRSTFIGRYKEELEAREVYVKTKTDTLNKTLDELLNSFDIEDKVCDQIREYIVKFETRYRARFIDAE